MQPATQCLYVASLGTGVRDANMASLTPVPRDAKKSAVVTCRSSTQSASGGQPEQIALKEEGAGLLPAPDD